MNRFDFTPYRRSTVGFDRLFDLLENRTAGGGDNYPPFNIERRGEDAYRVTLAVAGFKPEDLDITAQQNLLIVQGRKRDEAVEGDMLEAMKPKKIKIGGQPTLEVVRDDGDQAAA